MSQFLLMLVAVFAAPEMDRVPCGQGFQQEYGPAPIFMEMPPQMFDVIEQPAVFFVDVPRVQVVETQVSTAAVDDGYEVIQVPCAECPAGWRWERVPKANAPVAAPMSAPATVFTSTPVVTSMVVSDVVVSSDVPVTVFAQEGPYTTAYNRRGYYGSRGYTGRFRDGQGWYPGKGLRTAFDMLTPGVGPRARARRGR